MAFETAKQVMATAKDLDRTAETARRRLDALVDANAIASAEARRAARKIAAIRDDATDMAFGAAHLVVTNLNVTQTELTQVIDDARARLERIQNVAKFIDLIGDLAAFAAAATTGRPGTILAALKEIRHDIA